MQPCEQMHDYMFIIYGSDVCVLYFVKVYTFLKSWKYSIIFDFVDNKCLHRKNKEKHLSEWNHTKCHNAYLDGLGLLLPRDKIFIGFYKAHLMLAGS